MLRGIGSFRKFLIVGAVAAAPVMGVGCSNNTCTQVRSTSPCSAPSNYRVVSRKTVAAPRPVAINAINAPVSYASAGFAPIQGGSAGVVVSQAAPAAPAMAPVVYPAGYGYETAVPGSTVTYKQIPSRNLSSALSNIDGAAAAGVVRTSSAGSPVVSSVITQADLATAGVSYPTTVSVPVMGSAIPAASAGIPAGYYEVVSEVPATYAVPVATGVNPNHRRRGGQPGRRVHPRAVETVPVVSYPAATAGIPSGTPVYITPGGTAVSAYVPAPASGTYLGGAAPTGYLPVTERRGPDNAVIHYATRSICEYDPARGEDCVWTSGF